MKPTTPALWLLWSAALVPLAHAAPVSFRIEAGAATTPISPFIYGDNMHGEAAGAWPGAALGLTLARFGGNRLTAYNWENNASNAGTDWFNQNDGYLGGGDLPGEAVRARVAAAHAAQAAALVTVPLVDHVAADKWGDGDVNQSPDYLSTRFRRNYPRKGAPFAYPPALADGAVYQDEFVAWLEGQFPHAASDPRRRIFYALDNEPDLWRYTHPRVHPEATSYAELIRRSTETAAAIKAVAPHALVFGPVSYGYGGYVNLQGAPDAGGRDFLDTYLAAMREAEQAQGRRLVDVLDLHWYPEAHDSQWRRVTDDASDGDLGEARLQSPRSLWDPDYREASWIADDYLMGPIHLLPTLKAKIAAHYPGTQLAFTEYYYGGGAHISGALAQADVLGIFGREGVFAANLWHLGATDDRYIHAAFRAYRDYDGQGGRFGDRSLPASTSDLAKSAVYASRHSADGRRLTVLAINRSGESLTGDWEFTGSEAWRSASAWELSGAGAALVPKAQNLPVSGNRLSYTLPPYTLTVLRIGADEAPPPPPPVSEFRNDTDYAIPDRNSQGVASPIAVSRGGNAGRVRVGVAIKHPARGELIVRLIAPNGNAKTLSNRQGGSTPDLVETKDFDFGTAPAQGRWRLQVSDRVRGKTGYIDGWSLRFL